MTEKVARGIAADFATPLALWQAYQRAPTAEAAQTLLQDLAVRPRSPVGRAPGSVGGTPHAGSGEDAGERGGDEALRTAQIDRGVTARSTARRLGPALSARIHKALCGGDPNALLQALD